MRGIHTLSARFVASTKQPGMHCDGGGLYLQVTVGEAGSVGRSWVFRFKSPVTGKVRDMGLGSADTVPLADRPKLNPAKADGSYYIGDDGKPAMLPGARTLAAQARALVLQGTDPIEHRNAARAQAALAVIKNITFKDAVEKYIIKHENSWKPIHAKQWRKSLERYAVPKLGKLQVRAIDNDLVIQVLDPIWNAIPETAGRIRGRIESILDWARVNGYRDKNSQNPARWSKNLKHTLAERTDITKNRRAMDYRELPAFMTKLQARGETNKAARALEFLINTVLRPSEVLGARWDEIDFVDKVWTVPGGPDSRMKMKKEQRVPLTDAALAVLAKMPRTGELVFEGENGTLAHTAMRKVAASLGTTANPHGFRATFKTWASDRTTIAREVIEAALAHQVGDDTENAYQRGSYFERRRELMRLWSEYLTEPPVGDSEKVAQLRKSA